MQKIIPIDSTLANVKSILRSFDEAGLINESEMLTSAEWVINRLGISMMVDDELILEVEDGMADIPEHFKQLEFLYKCDSKDTTGYNTVRYYYGHPTKFTIRDYSKKVCVDRCEITEEFEEIKREIYIEGKQQVDRFCNKKLLSLHPGVPTSKLAENCINLHCKSPEKFNMNNEQFFFNFKEGHVYLKYKKTAVDSDGYPLVVDDPYVLKAIQDYIIYQSLLQIYYNSEVDVKTRLDKAEVEHRFSLGEALYNDKLPEYKKYVRYGKLRGSNLEIFNLKSQADAVFNSSKGHATRS